MIFFLNDHRELNGYGTPQHRESDSHLIGFIPLKQIKKQRRTMFLIWHISEQQSLIQTHIFRYAS